jgi:hypothetical protein
MDLLMSSIELCVKSVSLPISRSFFRGLKSYVYALNSSTLCILSDITTVSLVLCKLEIVQHNSFI